jgi:hypothetical protein
LRPHAPIDPRRRSATGIPSLNEADDGALVQSAQARDMLARDSPGRCTARSNEEGGTKNHLRPLRVACGRSFINTTVTLPDATNCRPARA